MLTRNNLCIISISLIIMVGQFLKHKSELFQVFCNCQKMQCNFKYPVCAPHCLETKLKHKRMGPLQFYISAFQNDPSYQKTKRIFEIHRGILEIIQFILSDKYMDRPGQGLRHFFSKNVE